VEGKDFDKKPAVALEIIALCLGKDSENVRGLIHDWVAGFVNRETKRSKPSKPFVFDTLFIGRVQRMFSSAVLPKQDPHSLEIHLFVTVLHRIIVQFEVGSILAEARGLADAETEAQA
jgi:hypothetical protein